MVGADVVMMTSALLRHGPDHVTTVEAGLRDWLTEHEYSSVDQLRGSASAATVEDPGRVRAGQLHGHDPVVDDAAGAHPVLIGPFRSSRPGHIGRLRRVEPVGGYLSSRSFFE